MGCDNSVLQLAAAHQRQLLQLCGPCKHSGQICVGYGGRVQRYGLEVRGSRGIEILEKPALMQVQFAESGTADVQTALLQDSTKR